MENLLSTLTPQSSICTFLLAAFQSGLSPHPGVGVLGFTTPEPHCPESPHPPICLFGGCNNSQKYYYLSILCIYTQRNISIYYRTQSAI